MALTLTIGGSNFLPQYKTGTARITEILQNHANSFTLQITKLAAQTKPAEGKEIVFKDGSRFLFGGYISKVEPTEVGKGSLFVYNVEATDYTYILINHNAQKTYTNQTLKQIVDDLLSTYASSYSINTTNVDTGPTIGTMVFNHISLRKCLEKLSQYTNYEWWIDYEKKLYFKPKDYKNAPEAFTDVSGNYSDVKIVTDASQVRNSIVVRGGVQITTSDLVEEFLGDAVQRTWILQEKPKSITAIYLDTGAGYVSKSFGIDPTDDEGSNYFMANFLEKYVRLATGSSTPAATHKVKVAYKYEIPVIVKLKSSLSIAAMLALEGGDGIHDYAITDPSLKSNAEARQRAYKELEEYANPLINGTIETRTGLLGAGTLFSIGQQVSIQMATWGISTATYYVIQQITTTLVEDGTNIEYNYSIRFGGRLLDASAFLQSIAGKIDVIDGVEQVDRIEAVQEDMTITETITRNNNVRSITESMTVAESVSKVNTTPPFQWGPGGSNPGKWGKFEWS